MRLVGEAVANFQHGEKEETPAEIKVDLPVNAHMPHDYVSSERLRLSAYRQIAQALTIEELNEAREELVDRYGALPEPVENLFTIAALRQRARAVGLREIVAMGPKVRFFPVNNLPESKQMRLERMYPGSLYRQVPGTDSGLSKGLINGSVSGERSSRAVAKTAVPTNITAAIMVTPKLGRLSSAGRSMPLTAKPAGSVAP